MLEIFIKVVKFIDNFESYIKICLVDFVLGMSINGQTEIMIKSILIKIPTFKILNLCSTVKNSRHEKFNVITLPSCYLSITLYIRN